MIKDNHSMDDGYKVTQVYNFNSDFKPNYTWLKNLTNKKYQDNKFLNEMKQFENRTWDNTTNRYKVDFNDIPNSQIVYHEKKTNSPDGFHLYRPSKFVQNYNNKHSNGAWSTSNMSSSSDSKRTTGQI